MIIKIQVRKNNYYDSMILLRINTEIAKMPGVLKAGIMMGTDRNKIILRDYGFWNRAMNESCASDLIICLMTEKRRMLEMALGKIETMIHERVISRKSSFRFSSFDAAFNALPSANFSIISIPGDFAANEVRKSLRKGINVFLFSDNVSIEEEIEVKNLAVQKGLLVMGPDCGTAIINGIRFGFANVTQKGPVGIIGASGTGIQEVCCLLEQFGNVGISHALGIGGRDLSDRVGGLMCLTAIDLLENDRDTQIIIIISKPPGEKTGYKILERVSKCKKPVILNYIASSIENSLDNNTIFASTFEESAQKAIDKLGGAIKRRDGSANSDVLKDWINDQRTSLSKGQKYLRGIFSGGSLCLEALGLLRKSLKGIYSNVPLEEKYKLKDAKVSFKHSIVDLGDDEFTYGRVHPMIDPTLVAERILQEGRDPEVAVIIFDVILGSGAHPNPAAILAEAVKALRMENEKNKRNIIMVSHVCGTVGDPQRISIQEKMLRDARVCLATSNQEAVEAVKRIFC